MGPEDNGALLTVHQASGLNEKRKVDLHNFIIGNAALSIKKCFMIDSRWWSLHDDPFKQEERSMILCQDSLVI